MLSHRQSSRPAADALSRVCDLPVYCYAVQAVADPGIMTRLLELFAKRGLVPSRIHAVLAEPERDELLIDIQVSGLTPDEGEHIARCLRQQVLVSSVLTCVTGQGMTGPGVTGMGVTGEGRPIARIA